MNNINWQAAREAQCLSKARYNPCCTGL